MKCNYTGTKFHYSNKNLKWKPICRNKRACRSIENKKLVTCENCLKLLMEK
jgi:hypothetical protein